MRGTYQPQHLKERDRMKLPMISYKPLVAAGLTGVMVAQVALTPAAAVAANLDVTHGGGVSLNLR